MAPKKQTGGTIELQIHNYKKISEMLDTLVKKIGESE